MRMMLHGLAPGMQHGDRADLGAEVARIGGDGAQRVRGGSKENVVDDPFVLECDLRCTTGWMRRWPQ